MKDIKGLILIICFIIELPLAILSIFYYEILGNLLMPAIITSVFLSLVAITISIIEIVKSERIGVVEKVLWIIGIMSVLNLVGLVYIILRRRRVVSV